MCQSSEYGTVVYARVNRILNMSDYGSVCLNTDIFNKLFFLTTMMSQLLKYLNEQLGVFLNVKQQKLSQLKHKKMNFYVKTFCIM